MSIRPLASLSAVLLPTLATAESASTPDLGSSLVSMFFGLAVVVALLFASLWLLRRLSAPRGAAAGMLRIVAAAAVGSRERIVIVDIGKSCLVLGVAPGSITALAELPRDSLPIDPPIVNQAGFAARLKQALDRHAR